MVFSSTDTSTYCIFTPTSVEKQNRSPDHLNARNPLFSCLSFATYPAAALTSCLSLYKQVILIQSHCMPRPRRTPGPWEARRKWMLLRGLPTCQSTSLCLRDAVTCCKANSATTASSICIPLGNGAESKVVEHTQKKGVGSVFGALTLSFLRLPRGFWGSTRKFNGWTELCPAAGV